MQRMFPDLFPPYLHILRADPARLDTVDMVVLWGGVGPAAVTTAVGGEAGKRGVQQGGVGAAPAVPTAVVEDGGESRAAALQQQLGHLEAQQQQLADQVTELKQILLAQQR